MNWTIATLSRNLTDIAEQNTIAISSRHDESARDFHGFPLLKNWQRRQCDKQTENHGASETELVRKVPKPCFTTLMLCSVVLVHIFMRFD